MLVTLFASHAGKRVNKKQRKEHYDEKIFLRAVSVFELGAIC